jgi:hypothetical protein
MHETINTRYIGFIDEHRTETATTNKIIGWAVNKTGSGFTAKNITLINTETRQHIPINTEIILRADVHKAYWDKPYSNNAPEEEVKYFYSGFSIEYPNDSYSITVCVNGVEIFNLTSPQINLDEVIKHNRNTKPELIVVDNFYENPDKVRDFALRQEFKADERYHKGNRTQKSYIPSWTKDEFSRLLNKQVSAFVGATGVFQYCVAKDNVVYHYDTQEYAAMVYLTPNAPLQTGTQTFRSKLTGLYTAATDADVDRLGMSKQEIDKKSFNGNNFYDRHNMELVDSVANVYNRCVIFNARALHAATSYFGDTKENSRLFHLYFFNCVNYFES